MHAAAARHGLPLRVQGEQEKNPVRQRCTAVGEKDVRRGGSGAAADLWGLKLLR